VPRWAIVVAIVVALIPATYLAAHRVFHDSSASPGDHTTDLPIPPVSPHVTVTPGATPTATSTKPASAPRLPRIAPDAPRRITSGNALDAGFDESVSDLDASSDSEVARWDPRGSPGSPGTDTVYVLGRVLADGDSAFADLSRLKRGSKVSIRTDRGTMTYTVSAIGLRSVSGLGDGALFTTHKPGRLVLVGIRYDDAGDRLGKALVITAQLSGAKKA
jgi:hypothetical protein